MSISSALSCARKNRTTLEAFQSSSYTISFDNNCIVTYQDGTQDIVPPLTFRPYQSEAHDALFVRNVKRLFLVRPRRAGKETESWNFLIESAIRRPGLYIMMYPTAVRGRSVLWDGGITMPDLSSKLFLDMVPKRLILGKPKQDEMKIKLRNGSVIRIMGADDAPDKMRGTNPLGIVFSEYAFSDPRVYQIIMPALRQNGGWAIIQTTFNGMNHAYRYMQEVKDNPEWYCRVDSAITLVNETGERYVTDAMIDEDRKSGMPEYLIQQEYYSVVSLNESSIYFAQEIKFVDDNHKIIPGKMLRVPFYTAWDIGMSDATSIIFFQIDEAGDAVIINYLENNNKNLEWYCNEINQFSIKNSLVSKQHFLPHDGEKREFTNVANQTIADSARKLGLDAISLPRPNDKLVAIQFMRQMLHRTTFNKENTTRLIECLSNYSKKFDEKHGVYKDRPIHDWASHGADSYQTMTLAIMGKHVKIGLKLGVVYPHDHQQKQLPGHTL